MTDIRNEKMRELLLKLREEMRNADIDSETRLLMKKFDTEVHALIEPDSPTTTPESAIDHAKLLQANFAIDHPVAERFLGEVVNALVKMGV